MLMVHFKQQHIFLTGKQFLCHTQKALHVAERVKEREGIQLVQHFEEQYVKKWDNKC